MCDCEMLMISPDGLLDLVSLEFLTIVNCPNLTSVVSIQGLASLQELHIESCDGMTILPIGLGSCTSLEYLKVMQCANLISVAEEDLRELKSLYSLTILDCENLKRLPLESCYPRLKELEIGRFSKDLDSFPFIINVDDIQQPPQLRDLSLFRWPTLKSLPDQIQHFTALSYLSLVDFEELEILLDWLEKLSSLKHLHISYCPILKSLPSVRSMRRLSNLLRLKTFDCPILSDRCGDDGPEWFKISRIPEIYIDFHEVQNLIPKEA